MKQRVMSAEQALAIYAVLVKHVGASTSDSDRDAFVQEFTTASQWGPTSEYRFCGNLGFGGKFRWPRMTVDCYPEDETPQRVANVNAANAELAELRASFGIEDAR